MAERIRCCVPFCKRTRRNDGFGEWICAKHWRLVPYPTRAAWHRVKRRVKKIVLNRPMHREYWRYEAGSLERLSAYSMWSRVDQAWEKCKREAIEGAAGI